MVDVSDPLELFSESDIANLLAKELRQNLRRYRQNPHPRGILLAGQPGAGKTGLSDLMISLLDGNAVFINADEYRRYHPNYRALYQKYGVVAVEKTAAFSATVTEKLIAEMSDRHINLIIEGTGRTVEVPRATARLLASKGYDVELAVLAVRPETSLTSTLLRFYQMNEGERSQEPPPSEHMTPWCEYYQRTLTCFVRSPPSPVLRFGTENFAACLTALRIVASHLPSWYDFGTARGRRRNCGRPSGTSLYYVSRRPPVNWDRAMQSMSWSIGSDWCSQKIIVAKHLTLK